ncbi:jg7901 [Pararge aegeria aegeria]|uniref:Jg7901 protein n=1 Tax=Pararge aegeria aegeria TaxID=348720 RepID=A0A8S4RE56_9NEOP|nr:jg7901 [Pararge aegeria aegeria]
MALKMEPKNDLDFILKNLLAGGVAGMCAKTTVAPLDRIKILLQAQSSHYKHHGVLGGLMAIVKQESLIALYKGNGAQMVRIFPYAATQFTSFEIYKRDGVYKVGVRLQGSSFLHQRPQIIEGRPKVPAKELIIHIIM